MKITINWTDHKYNTYDFQVVDQLPAIGDVIDKPGDYRQTVDAIKDVTDIAARSDFGDGGRYKLYIVYFHDEIYVVDEEDTDGNEIFYLEENGTSYKAYAVREVIL